MRIPQIENEVTKDEIGKDVPVLDLLDDFRRDNGEVSGIDLVSNLAMDDL